MLSRYEALFARLRAQNQGAFVPFVTLGDPNLELSLRIVQALIDAGADALELGIPFSDPLADGPVIQAANARALAAGATVNSCLDMIGTLRRRNPNIPIGLLMYANLVYVGGMHRFYQMAADAGVDSILVADVSLQESADFIAAAHANQIAPVMMLPPGTDTNTLKQIVETSEGYLYLMSRSGVTGADRAAAMPLRTTVETLQRLGGSPALLGFGISTPIQVRQAMSAGVAGVIAGSAIVKLIAEVRIPERLLTELGEFVRAMKSATVNPPN